MTTPPQAAPSEAEKIGALLQQIFESETGVTGGTSHAKLKRLVALAQAAAPAGAQPSDVLGVLRVASDYLEDAPVEVIEAVQTMLAAPPPVAAPATLTFEGWWKEALSWGSATERDYDLCKATWGDAQKAVQTQRQEDAK